MANAKSTSGWISKFSLQNQALLWSVGSKTAGFFGLATMAFPAYSWYNITRWSQEIIPALNYTTLAGTKTLTGCTQAIPTEFWLYKSPSNAVLCPGDAVEDLMAIGAPITMAEMFGMYVNAFAATALFAIVTAIVLKAHSKLSTCCAEEDNEGEDALKAKVEAGRIAFYLNYDMVKYLGVFVLTIVPAMNFPFFMSNAVKATNNIARSLSLANTLPSGATDTASCLVRDFSDFRYLAWDINRATCTTLEVSIAYKVSIPDTPIVVDVTVPSATLAAAVTFMRGILGSWERVYLWELAAAAVLGFHGLVNRLYRAYNSAQRNPHPQDPNQSPKDKQLPWMESLDWWVFELTHSRSPWLIMVNLVTSLKTPVLAVAMAVTILKIYYQVYDKLVGSGRGGEYGAALQKAVKLGYNVIDEEKYWEAAQVAAKNAAMGLSEGVWGLYLVGLMGCGVLGVSAFCITGHMLTKYCGYNPEFVSPTYNPLERAKLYIDDMSTCEAAIYGMLGVVVTVWAITNLLTYTDSISDPNNICPKFVLTAAELYNSVVRSGTWLSQAYPDCDAKTQATFVTNSTIDTWQVALITWVIGGAAGVALSLVWATKKHCQRAGNGHRVASVRDGPIDRPLLQGCPEADIENKGCEGESSGTSPQISRSRRVNSEDRSTTGCCCY